MQDDCIIIALGLPEVRVVREEETEKEITVEVRYRAESAVCPRCGRQTPKVHGTRAQRKRDRELWDKPVFLVLHKRRFRCLGCRKIFTEPNQLFGARRRSSRRFREHLGREALHQTVRYVAHKKSLLARGRGEKPPAHHCVDAPLLSLSTCRAHYTLPSLGGTCGAPPCSPWTPSCYLYPVSIGRYMPSSGHSPWNSPVLSMETSHLWRLPRCPCPLSRPVYSCPWTLSRQTILHCLGSSP